MSASRAFSAASRLFFSVRNCCSVSVICCAKLFFASSIDESSDTTWLLRSSTFRVSSPRSSVSSFICACRLSADSSAVCSSVLRVSSVATVCCNCASSSLRVSSSCWLLEDSVSYSDSSDRIFSRRLCVSDCSVNNSSCVCSCSCWFDSSALSVSATLLLAKASSPLSCSLAEDISIICACASLKSACNCAAFAVASSRSRLTCASSSSRNAMLSVSAFCSCAVMPSACSR